MFVQKAPMKVVNQTIDCEWKAGDSAMQVLKDILAECVERKMVIEADVNVMAMAVWSMVHGLVSLANTQRMNKFVVQEEVLPMMTKGLNWLMNTMDVNVK
jgi:branched-subunit amino acid permease